jgi:hypothetical protein
MATRAAVNAGSRFCRDCGGPITERGGFAWCENGAPQDVCANSTRIDRRFCEHCGEADPGPGACTHCGQRSTNP